MEGYSLESSDGVPAISLRPFDLPDIDDLMAIISDENVTRFSFGEPSLITREKGLSYIKNYMIPHPFFMAICVNNRPIGTISVDQYKGSDKCRALLGYMLASGYWGRGIATKAVKMVVSDVFDLMPELERLEALVDVENLASLRVLEKAGFQREGVMRKYKLLKGMGRDMVMFSLLNTDSVSAA